MLRGARKTILTNTMCRTGTDDNPLKRWEADALRAESILAWQQREGVEDNVPKFTCETCVFLAWCEYAYDHYNTDGDCLAIK